MVAYKDSDIWVDCFWGKQFKWQCARNFISILWTIIKNCSGRKYKSHNLSTNTVSRLCVCVFVQRSHEPTAKSLWFGRDVAPFSHRTSSLQLWFGFFFWARSRDPLKGMSSRNAAWCDDHPSHTFDFPSHVVSEQV